MNLQIALGIAVIILLVSSYSRMVKRRKTVQKLANRIGFYYMHNKAELKQLLRGFKIHSSRGTVYNIIQGHRSHVTWTVFECKWLFNTNSQPVHYLVVLAQLSRIDLPEFHLSPQRLKDMGGVDITFEDNPEFSQRYFLKAHDEEGVRALFNPKVLEYFQHHPEDVYVEASGDKFVYYCEKMLDTSEFLHFLEDAEQALDLFRPSMKA